MGENEGEQHSHLAVVHSLPIKTTFRGTTDIGENFTRHIVRSETGELRNTFRGRRLIGREVTLPPSYVLAFMNFASRNAQQRMTGAAGRMMSAAPPMAQVEATAEDIHVAVTTDRFCLWEHDKKPDRAEALQQWLELSHAIHHES